MTHDRIPPRDEGEYDPDICEHGGTVGECIHCLYPEENLSRGASPNLAKTPSTSEDSAQTNGGASVADVTTPAQPYFGTSGDGPNAEEGNASAGAETYPVGIIEVLRDFNRRFAPTPPSL